MKVSKLTFFHDNKLKFAYTLLAKNFMCGSLSRKFVRLGRRRATYCAALCRPTVDFYVLLVSTQFQNFVNLCCSGFLVSGGIMNVQTLTLIVSISKSVVGCRCLVPRFTLASLVTVSSMMSLFVTDGQSVTVIFSHLVRQTEHSARQ